MIHYTNGAWSSLPDSNRLKPTYKAGHHQQCLESLESKKIGFGFLFGFLFEEEYFFNTYV